MRVWRLARAGYPLFDGEGTRRFGSRWIPRGRRAVHTSATLSLAALELLVHTDPDLTPLDLVMAYADIPDTVSIHHLEVRDLPRGWRTYPGPDALHEIGSDWLERKSAAVLSLPSAVIPIERNFVLNPAHAAFDAFQLGTPEPFTVDPRLFSS